MSEIIKKEDPKPFRLGGSVGLAAKKKAVTSAITNNTTPTLPPAQMPDRIGIVMDDSGSMAGKAIKDAHEGIEEFLRNCKPTTTAVCVYPMNEQPLHLCTTLPQLAQLVKNISATGGTPLLETLHKMITNEQLTRAIVFSDGYPNTTNMDEEVKLCTEKRIPVDTVFIGEEDSYAITFMKELATRTGGVFLHFIPGKSSFATAFKYLTPGFRALLMDEETRKKVERGELK